MQIFINLMVLKIFDICSGVGGFSQALESIGEEFETVAFCEIDEYCREVLEKHWPNVPIYNDLWELAYEPERVVPDWERVTFDIICGGIPCQPFSVAGKQRGKKDPRHLWPPMFEIIKRKKPKYTIVENVSGFINVALDDVCTDLESEGYATQSFIIPASGIGAPHQRQRCWIIGKSVVNTDSLGSLLSTHETQREGNTPRHSEGEPERGSEVLADSDC
jgi:DNA (cytosine-5)-methyltransferase 1